MTNLVKMSLNAISWKKIVLMDTYQKLILNIDVELHELHDENPLAPEKHEISHNMLLNYCSSIGNEYFIQMGGVNELVSNLDDKFI